MDLFNFDDNFEKTFGNVFQKKAFLLTTFDVL